MLPRCWSEDWNREGETLGALRGWARGVPPATHRQPTSQVFCRDNLVPPLSATTCRRNMCLPSSTLSMALFLAVATLSVLSFGGLFSNSPTGL